MRGEHLVQGVEHLGDSQILGRFHREGEVAPEVAQHLLPIDLVRRDLVQLLFEIRREIIFHIAGEEALEEGRDEAPLVLGDETLLLQLHIFAVPQHREHGGIGGRPADAELFHTLHERGFRIARRRLGEMLGGDDVAARQRLARAHGGQAAAFFVLVLVVAAFAIEGQEAVELHYGSGGGQLQGAAAGIGADIGGGALQLRRFHLARHGAGPDQIVESRLLGIEMARHGGRRAARIGGADRLVRFLRVLRLGRVFARNAGR